MAKPDRLGLLRSYAIGAAHMALGWVCTESLSVDPATGVVHDLTIRSFGILRAKDMPPVAVEVVDRDGIVVPHAVTPVRFRLTGAGELAAAGNADPRHAASFRQPECVPFCGRALVIVRPKGRAGVIALHAEAEGLAPATVKVTAGR